MSPAVRVGIIVLLAIIALGGVAWFLTGYRIRVSGYNVTGIFSDAQGMTVGSEVRMAGVVIGVVDRVGLDEHDRASILMLINRKYKIPVGSTFTLRVGLVIGDKYIDIQPNRQSKKFIEPGTVVQGLVPPRIEDLLPLAQRVLNNLNLFATNINNIVGKKDFQERLDRSFRNIERATELLRQTMSVIQGTVAGEQDEVEAIIQNVQLASQNLVGLTRELEQFIGEPGTKENIQGTLEAARNATESLDRTANSLEKLVTAPGFQEDIRQTVKDAREAAEEAKQVIGRIGGVFGGGGRKPRITTRETKLEGLYIPDDGLFRATLQTTIPQRDDRFLNLGIYDFGGENNLILQGGEPIGGRTDFRYGLYASKLGLGLDYQLTPRTSGTINLYDPNSPRFDFEAGYAINDNWGLLLGVDRLFDENQITLGARWTR